MAKQNKEKKVKKTPTKNITKKMTIKDLIFTSPMILGIFVIFFYSHYKITFYHTGSYKLLIIMCALSFFFILFDCLYKGNHSQREKSWRTGLLVFFPILGTFPGLILHQAEYNYNFKYELATDLMMILWTIYLIRLFRSTREIKIFLVFVGIAFIYTGIFAFCERVGYPFWPHLKETVGVDRVKTTFGNINYFAGTLVVIAPLVFMMIIPQYLGNLKFKWEKSHLFFLIVWGFVVMSLAFTVTRAAIGATLVTHFLAFFFSLMIYFPKRIKQILILFISGVLLGILTFILIKVFEPDFIIKSRFGSLFYIKGWANRILPWEAAWDSILSSPLFGYGLGSSYNLFFLFVNPLSRITWPERSFNHVHSEWLEILQETGFIGFITYILFYGFFFFQLGKIFINANTSFFDKKLALAAMAAVIGFYFHGFFSLAQRMIETNFAIYSVYALGFYLIWKYNKESKILYLKYFNFSKNIYRFVLPSSVLLLIYFLYIPWLIKQYYHFEGITQRYNTNTITKLEKQVYKYNDLYALDHLINLQIQTNRLKEALATEKIITEILPKYRGIDGRLHIIYSLLKDDDKALQHAIQEYESDRYNEPNLANLARIAIKKNDKETFRKAMHAQIDIILYNIKSFNPFYPDNISVKFEEQNEFVKYFQDNNQFKLTMSEQFWTFLQENVSQLWTKSNTERQKILNQIIDEFQKEKQFFQIRPRVAVALDQVQQQKVQAMINRFHQFDQRKTDAIKAYNEKLGKINKLRITSVRFEKLKEEKSRQKEFLQQLEEEKQILSLEIDKLIQWQNFLDRRKILQETIKWYQNVIKSTLRFR